eukprot:scaffold24402_cov16-Tisochrysis_lutea.AAC.2
MAVQSCLQGFAAARRSSPVTHSLQAAFEALQKVRLEGVSSNDQASTARARVTLVKRTLHKLMAERIFEGKPLLFQQGCEDLGPSGF